ncbi:MAG: calcium/sodium antiporter [Maricaulaceae bacterium]
MPFALLVCLMIAGLVGLLVAGDVLVRGAAALARRLGIGPLIVGLTVVAFGTSAPEMFVSVDAVRQGASGIAVGNIVGSNIANVFLVLGMPALFGAIAAPGAGARSSAAIGLAAALIVWAMSFAGALGLWQGVVLLAGILGYLAFLFRRAQTGVEDPSLAELADVDHIEGLPQRGWSIAGCILFGLAGLPLGAKLIVESGIEMAERLAVPEEIIGLTALAVGTSLPELAATVLAAMRKHTELAVGNVIGSNIFNLFAVLGVTALAGTVPVSQAVRGYDMLVMVAAAIVLFGLTLAQKGINRLTGVVLLFAYAGYLFGVTQVGRAV